MTTNILFCRWFTAVSNSERIFQIG